MRTASQLCSDLGALGIERGDAVLVRASVKALGPVSEEPARALISALLQAVGEEGTILGLSHTATTRRFSPHPAFFSRNTPCITGGFVAAMLSWPGAYRSRHPTNSMVAIGKNAEAFLSEHDESSTCFGPMRHLVDAGAKMLLVGCSDASPGFSTVHLAYEELGLADKSTISGVYGAFYEKAGHLQWFSKRDVPGCSKGFGNFYPLYRTRGVLHSGKVGEAETLMIGAKEAFSIEHDAVRDPTIGLCTRPACYSCSGTKLFNPRGMLKYYTRRPHMLVRLAEASILRLVGG